MAVPAPADGPLLDQIFNATSDIGTKGSAGFCHRGEIADCGLLIDD